MQRRTLPLPSEGLSGAAGLTLLQLLGEAGGRGEVDPLAAPSRVGSMI